MTKILIDKATAEQALASLEDCAEYRVGDPGYRRIATVMRVALAEQPAPTNCRHCGGADNVICGGQCKEQPAPVQQEPVAGLLVGQDSDGRYVSIAAKAHADTLPLGEYKLFTSPQPAQQEQRYSIDKDPSGIRAAVCDAVIGALAFGAQGENPPPAGHWLAQFWQMARSEREQQAPVQQEPVACMKCGAPLGTLHLVTGDKTCPFGQRVLYSDCAPQPAQQEPVAGLSETQAKAILDLALDLEKTGRLVAITEGQERTDFVARNRNIQCALVDALRNATTPQPPAQQQEPVGRTDQQIVDQTEELALWLLSWAFNYQPETKRPMRESVHPFAQRCWAAACHIQEMLTATDPENAVAELDNKPSECTHLPPAQQKPVVLPCCGYTDASAIKWNPHNHVVQCHSCGQIYTANGISQASTSPHTPAPSPPAQS